MKNDKIHLENKRVRYGINWLYTCLMIIMLVLFVVLIYEMSVQMPYGWKNQTPKQIIENGELKTVYYWKGFDLSGVIACGVLLVIAWLSSIFVGSLRVKKYADVGEFSLFLVMYGILAVFFILVACLYNSDLYNNWVANWVSNNNNVIDGYYSQQASLNGIIPSGVIGAIIFVICYILYWSKADENKETTQNITNQNNIKNPSKNSSNIVILDNVFKQENNNETKEATYNIHPDHTQIKVVYLEQ